MSSTVVDGTRPRMQKRSSSSSHGSRSTIHSVENRQPPSLKLPPVPLTLLSLKAEIGDSPVEHGKTGFTVADLGTRLMTPAQSPMASPFKFSRTKVIDVLLMEEQIYARELAAIQTIVNENLFGHELDELIKPVESMIDLTSELRAQLSQTQSYFSDPQRDCLLHFAKCAESIYQSYFQSFRLGISEQFMEERDRSHLHDILAGFSYPDEVAKDLDWLMRRPLSRIKAYTSTFKKLLHTSEDATDLFIAHDTLHGLLGMAKEVMEKEKRRLSNFGLDKEISRTVQSGSRAYRSASGGSTSTTSSVTTTSSTNSRLASHDELLGLQDTLGTTQVRDLFSLRSKEMALDLISDDPLGKRSLVSRDMFQMVMLHSSTEELVDILVEIILLTDMLLVVRPTFNGPFLYFPPIKQDLFQVSYIPSEPRIFELDIIGQETIRFTAISEEKRNSWYQLLLQCQNWELHNTPAVMPASLSMAQVGSSKTQIPLAPSRMPPTPPHTTGSCNFPMPLTMTAPLRVIRENSTLSLGTYSDLQEGALTPDESDRAPFHYDLDDEPTPKAVSSEFPDPIDSYNFGVSQISTTNPPHTSYSPVVGDHSSNGTPKLLLPDANNFPQPPQRSPRGSSVLERSQSEQLQPRKSSKDNMVGASKMTTRSTTVVPESSLSLAQRPSMKTESTQTQSVSDDIETMFDEMSLDVPTLPAFDFGDGVPRLRPMSTALNFSPNTLTAFGIPTRKVPAPRPFHLPSVEPLNVKKSPTKNTNSSLAHRRLGSQLSLRDAIATTTPQDKNSKPNTKVVTMCECSTWEQGYWTPMAIDTIDAERNLRCPRSYRVTVMLDVNEHSFLEIFDKKQNLSIISLYIYRDTSIIRDDPCDISVGFDVGIETRYFQFICESPDKANTLQHILNQAKYASNAHKRPTSIDSKVLTTIRSEELNVSRSNKTIVLDSLKLQYYLFEAGRWINKGKAKVTIRLLPNDSNRRITLFGKTKKGERILILDTVALPGDCEMMSKTSITVRTRLPGAVSSGQLYMLQLSSGKERQKVMDLLK